MNCRAQAYLHTSGLIASANDFREPRTRCTDEHVIFTTHFFIPGFGCSVNFSSEVYVVFYFRWLLILLGGCDAEVSNL